MCVIDLHEHITERCFLAAVIQLHTAQGRKPRAIQVAHVLHCLRGMSDKQIDFTLAEMEKPNRRKCMKRCRTIHKPLWEAYKCID